MDRSPDEASHSLPVNLSQWTRAPESRGLEDESIFRENPTETKSASEIKFSQYLKLHALCPQVIRAGQLRGMAEGGKLAWLNKTHYDDAKRILRNNKNSDNKKKREVAEAWNQYLQMLQAPKREVPEEIDLSKPSEALYYQQQAYTGSFYRNHAAHGKRRRQAHRKTRS